MKTKYSLKELQNLKYKNNYLTEVIFRIDFSPIYKISEKKPAKFQDIIRKEFPKSKEDTIIEIKSTFMDKKKIDEERIVSEFNFVSNDKLNLVKLSEHSLIIVIKKYNDFKDYKELILKVYNGFYENYNPIDINRLGLRYINKINFKKGNPLDWDKLINPLLIKYLDFAEDRREISRSLSKLCLNKDFFNVVFNFGIANPQFPSKVAEREYILDYDCYTLSCKEDEVEDMITIFNKEVKKLFENSITDKLRDIMGVLND